ncbi:hypothetical protein CXB51_016480 [Gossypium anomalum]|uniref:Uncharacterized protein n=1 Tax=Gossypium anomalum TaxID=47600 RepID=A0A8J6CXR1_9ROSI|nr:hypothetical protein CXB51_016480 [Gossypium anomalum]
MNFYCTGVMVTEFIIFYDLNLLKDMIHYQLTTRESTFVAIHTWSWMHTSVLSVGVIISSMHIGPFLIAPIFANCLHLKINRIKFRYDVLLLFVEMKLNRFASFEPL